MYKPAAQRRGLFRAAGPVRRPVVGNLDAPPTAKPGYSGSTRSTRTPRSPGTMTAAIDREIEDLADGLRLELRCPGERESQYRAWDIRACQGSGLRSAEPLVGGRAGGSW